MDDEERARPKVANPREVARQRAAEPTLSLGEKADLAMARPRTRGECATSNPESLRPCPFVGCRHHLLLSVNAETGAITFNFPDKEFDEIEETCSLDVADEVGGMTLERVGELVNLTRERVRQLETGGLAMLRAAMERR